MKLSDFMTLAGAFIASMILASQVLAVGATGFTTQLVGAKALGQGNAFAAEADDPSAIYFNPAGLTQLHGAQLMLGGDMVVPYVDRTGAGTPDDHMKRQLSVVPNFYLTDCIALGSESLAFGVGLTSPFGLTTEWAPTSSVRYVTTTAKFQMVNINPSLAYAIVPALSLGAGLDYVNLFNTVAQSQINQAAANGDNSSDGSSNLSGHGSGWGYNVGALFKPVEKHSFGLSYRSQVRIPVRGNVELSNLSASTQNDFNFEGSAYSADATTSVILPASVLAGYAYRPTDRWTLLADYEWTQWNSLQNEDIAINESDPFRRAFLTGNPSSNMVRTPRNWRNVSAVGTGANYRVNDAWQVRGGYAFFEKTAPNDTFDADVPDSSVHLVTAGFSRTFKSMVLDFAWNAYFYTNRIVSNTIGNAAGGSVNGTYKTFVPSVALDLTYKIP